MAEEDKFKTESFPNKTITVSFGEREGDDGEGESGSITLELDDEKNDGKTDFLFEEDCWLRVVASGEDYTVRPSKGEVVYKGESTITLSDEKVTFSDSDTASTSKAIRSISSKSFDGRGDVGVIAADPEGSNTLKNSKGALIGVLTISYTSACRSHKLKNVSMPNGYDEENDPGMDVIVVARIGESSAEVTVPFKAKREDAESNETIALFLDDNAPANYESAEDYPDGSVKSRFRWDESAVFRTVLSDWENPYEVMVSYGVASKTATGEAYYMEDQIAFSYTKEGSLTYPPMSSPAYSWTYGSSGGEPTFDGTTVTIENEIVGFLDVFYDTKSDTWSVSVPSAPLNNNGEEALYITVNVVAYQEANKISASATVEFGDLDEETSGKSVSVSLDDKKNEEVYGEGTTTFPYGKKAFLKVIGPKPYNAYASFNSAQLLLEGRSILYDVEEDVSIVNTDEASLSNDPGGSVSYEWIGVDPGLSPNFNGDAITFADVVRCGVLRCTYKVSGQRWSVMLPSDPLPGDDSSQADVLCVFVPTEYQDLEGSTTVSFGGEESEEEYEIIIVDSCSDEPVPGAHVSGGIVGVCGPVTADDSGKVYRGKISVGKHAVGNITATGYIPSHSDPIDNEEIQVSPPSGDEET